MANEKTNKPRRNKLKFTVEMLINGNLRSTASKAANSIVSFEECEEFVNYTKERLDELLTRWFEMYHVSK